MNTDLGIQIQTRRKTLGFSQTELAKRLGVTTAYISKIESGTTPPSDELCKKIVPILELDELAERSLRASALQERTGIKVEDICPHVQTTGKKELRTTYEVTLVEASRSLDDRQRSEILDWILLLNSRNKPKSIAHQHHRYRVEIVDTESPSSPRHVRVIIPVEEEIDPTPPAVKRDSAVRQTVGKMRAEQRKAIQMHAKLRVQKSVDKSSKKSRSDT